MKKGAVFHDRAFFSTGVKEFCGGDARPTLRNSLAQQKQKLAVNAVTSVPTLKSYLI
jgi:hypothetical protein